MYVLTKEQLKEYRMRVKIRKEEKDKMRNAEQRIEKLLKVFTFDEVNQLFLKNDVDDKLAHSKTDLINKVKGWGE